MHFELIRKANVFESMQDPEGRDINLHLLKTRSWIHLQIVFFKSQSYFE